MYIKIVSVLVVVCTLIGTTTYGQENDNKKSMKISLGSDGLGISSNTKKSDDGKTSESRFDVEVGVIDIGLNSLQDKTDYSNPAVQNFSQVPMVYQNENLYSLRSGKSWNVNIWPVLTSWKVVNTNMQRIHISTGIGLQMYNFRFNRPVTYINEVTPIVYLDSVNTITKNKLGFTYLSVPLMLTFKTRAAEKAWLVYGFGITGGYRLSSWNKQVSIEKGKQKNHDKFNFSDFNSCVTAEIGLDEIFRLYASYQITPLQSDANGPIQHPFCLGIRFGGI